MWCLFFSCQWLITEVTLGFPADNNQASCWSHTGWTDVFSFITSLKNDLFRAPSLRTFWCVSQPEGTRCAVIMHQYVLTISWLNTVNRCTSNAWIILCVLILSACSVPFHYHDYMPDVLLLCCSLSSVDHLCAGCSSHTDSYSHGGKTAAAHHSKVSFSVCLISNIGTDVISPGS